jgi:FkbM family methyltransferase
MSLLKILKDSQVPIKNSRIYIPEFCTKVKIDVGLSSDATQSAAWLTSDPELIVFGFEPVSTNVSNLKNNENQAIFQFINKQFFILPVALGSKRDSAQIHVTEEDAGRSSLMKPKNFRVAHLENIEIFTLNDFLDLFPFEIITRIDYIKTDCQGSDLEVLEGGNRFLEKIAVITSECDDSSYLQTENSLDSMNDFLKDYSFECINLGMHKILIRCEVIYYVSFLNY